MSAFSAPTAVPLARPTAHTPQVAPRRPPRAQAFDMAAARATTPATVRVPEGYAARAGGLQVADVDEYARLYAESVRDPDAFWGRVAREGFHWEKPPGEKVLEGSFGEEGVRFADGASTNVAYNCLDRQVEMGRGDVVAVICEPNDPADEDARRSVTYAEMLERVKGLAKVLRKAGVGKGDVVTVYMPMVVELVVSMLACARIGAVHSVVFGGFSAEALAGRVCDAKSNFVVTCDGVYRGKKLIPLKKTVDSALDIAEERGAGVGNVLVMERVGRGVAEVEMKDGRDMWWDEAVEDAKDGEDHVEWVQSEDPLFVLYTSGSTGKPKGIQHTTGGYMVYAATTFKYVFNYQPGDVFFCTADCGWITGHSYVTYGPMLNGATQVVFEGVPNYPDAGRLWEITDRHKVAMVYTAPTAIRALKRAGDEFVTKYSRESIKLLGTVGEPINPEAYMWYFNVVGDKRCPIVDTWWQTETGGICMTPQPIAGLDMKPGWAMMPFFGVEPALLNESGEEIEGPGSGYLVIKKPWPSVLRTIYGDHQRMMDVYFSRFPGYYMTGDGALRDEDGHYILTGRVDDVLNVSGHRMGTAEVESALVLHASVVEAAVVGVPHDIKGEDIYAYVTLVAGEEPSEELRAVLKTHVRQEIGPIATPGTIHWAPALPKTRSGKIMRRILRKIAAKGGACGPDDFGDTSTLADEAVVQQLVDAYGK